MLGRFLLAHAVLVGSWPVEQQTLQPELYDPTGCHADEAVTLLLRDSACPDVEAMYSEMAKVDMLRKGPHQFMSVGCNRGEDLVRFSQLFDGTRHTFDHSSWVSALRKAGGIHLHDICNAENVSARTAQVAEASQPPQAYCIEGMRSNVRLLNQTLRLLPALNPALTVVGSAFGGPEEVGTKVHFPECAAGREQGGIGIHLGWSDCSNVEVPVDSVDNFMSVRGMKRLDALFVDTEGHDPAVLDGARRLLDNGLVRYVEFEVHQDLKSLIWSRRSLRSVTSPLEAAGYQCYWMGRGKLTSLSGYYHPMYDQKTLGWSNIACVQRTDPWHSIVNSWSRGGLCESYGKEADKEARRRYKSWQRYRSRRAAAVASQE